MAMVSSTPVLSSYGTSRPAYQYSGRQLARPYGPRPVAGKESPLDALGHSAGFSADAPVMQRIDICESSDDDISQPMKFSALTRALLEAEQASPGKAPGRAAAARGETPSKAAQLRISRRSPDSSSSASASRRTVSVPAACVYRDEPVSSQSHLTPGQGLHSRAPTATGMHSGSIRVKRVPVGTGTFLRGAPVRKQKRTPQTDDEENQPPAGLADSGLREKHQLDRPQSRARGEHHVPLAPISVNTPLRPAPPPPAPPQLQQQPPPPPPKMTVLETATAAGGASTTKSKRKRTFFLLNGKHFSLMGRVGKGGSSEVFRVVAENSKIFALKRVKLDDSDESAVRGYKGEIDLLKKLRNVDRVVVLFDWEIDEDKKILSLVGASVHLQFQPAKAKA